MTLHADPGTPHSFRPPYTVRSQNRHQRSGDIYSVYTSSLNAYHDDYRHLVRLSTLIRGLRIQLDLLMLFVHSAVISGRAIFKHLLSHMVIGIAQFIPFIY